MKRFHAHVSVADLAEGVRFYSALFGTPPSVQKDDYAKWQIDDPRVNFAISARGAQPGLDHLGIQTDSDAELEALHGQLEAAELALRSESEVACCYARSNKHWVQDPSGIAWETFHTLGSVPTFNEAADTEASACCAPVVTTRLSARIPVNRAADASKPACCG
jgi:lactoylglutathione lyase